jgi:enoyl-CoA hydratase
MTEDVIVRVEHGLGRLTLNRPEALHALTTAMCELMIETLLGWRGDPAVRSVLIDHSGGRGFCAGGDIRMLSDSLAGDGEAARRFFFTEYQLDDLLFGYPKPTVAIMDGVTMGGGVGISLPALHRIATERTSFAMPETGIGLFPDVGGGWYLPRLPGQSGTWLALTGARLKAADCMALGVVTHFVETARLEAFKSALVAASDDPDAAVSTFSQDAGPPPLAPHRADIDRLFSAGSVEAIAAALALEGSEWAQAQLQILRTKSPLSSKVALRQLREGAHLRRFAEVMTMEYRVAMRLMRGHDFAEGVRAVVIDKDNAPRWDPPSLEAVTPEMVEAVFAPLPTGQEWAPQPD